MKAELNWVLLTDTLELVESAAPALPLAEPFSGLISAGALAARSTAKLESPLVVTLAMLPMPFTSLVLTLWFWGHDTLPGRYLRALRTSLPHVRLVVLTDDVHHRRLELMGEQERGDHADGARTHDHNFASCHIPALMVFAPR